MNNLIIKTRGNSLAKNKPKIYISYHQNDLKKLDEIILELHSYMDVAVCYLDYTKEFINDDYQLMLNQMNLFILVVSKDYLLTDNFALNELKLIKECNTPILPLMQECGLDQIFNQKCGDLQYLNKYEITNSDITYEEKITSYLNKVLYQDDLSNDIKEMFSAYIFLSYRKKDRKVAQDLIRRIHQNDFMRDIAIWYDEFLTPGEDFNESISEALEKSDLFVLTVTPNIVNEENYIMTTEYPLAKSLHKTIIPCEVSKTNQELIDKYYSELPKVINTTSDEDSFNKIFNNEIKKINNKNKEFTPRKKYHLGLAYLYGIDVLKNNDYAKELIISSGEDNYIDAIKKLVDMYLNGEGVKKSYQDAIFWQERLVSVYQNKFNELLNEGNTLNYLDSLSGLISYYYDINDYDHAKLFLNDKIQLIFSLMINKDAQYDWLSSSLAMSFETFGNIEASVGNLDASYVYLEKASEIFELIKDKPDGVNNLKRLAHSYCRLASIHSDKGQIKEANNFYIKALDIYEDLYKKNKTVNNKYNLALFYGDYGDFLYELGSYKYAQELYEDHLKYAKSLYEEKRVPLYNRMKSLAYVRCGNLYRSQDNKSQALEYYQEAYSIDLKLIGEGNEISANEMLALSSVSIAQVLIDFKNYQEAKKYLAKAIEINEYLTNLTSNIVTHLNLGINYKIYGEILFKEKDLNNATKYYIKAIDIFKNLYVTNLPSAVDQLIEALYSLALIFKANNEFNQALTYLDDAVTIIDVQKEKTKLIKYYNFFIDVKVLMAYIYQKENNFDKSYLAYTEAYSTCHMLIKKLDKVEYFYTIESFSYEYVMVLMELNLYENALNIAETALRICSILADKHPDQIIYKEEIDKFNNIIKTLKKE